MICRRCGRRKPKEQFQGKSCRKVRICDACSEEERIVASRGYDPRTHWMEETGGAKELTGLEAQG